MQEDGCELALQVEYCTEYGRVLGIFGGIMGGADGDVKHLRKMRYCGGNIWCIRLVLPNPDVSHLFFEYEYVVISEITNHTDFHSVPRQRIRENSIVGLNRKEQVIERWEGRHSQINIQSIDPSPDNLQQTMFQLQAVPRKIELPPFGTRLLFVRDLWFEFPQGLNRVFYSRTFTTSTQSIIDAVEQSEEEQPSDVCNNDNILDDEFSVDSPTSLKLHPVQQLSPMSLRSSIPRLTLASSNKQIAAPHNLVVPNSELTVTWFVEVVGAAIPPFNVPSDSIETQAKNATTNQRNRSRLQTSLSASSRKQKEVVVVGGCEELGLWDVQKGVLMQSENFPYCTVSIKLDRTQLQYPRQIEYKYVLVEISSVDSPSSSPENSPKIPTYDKDSCSCSSDNDSEGGKVPVQKRISILEWEDGENRRVTLERRFADADQVLINDPCFRVSPSPSSPLLDVPFYMSIRHLF